MDLCEIKAENYFEVQRMKQIAIYTCISGDYDEVLIPNHIADECDYYVISDKKEKEDSFFTYFDLVCSRNYDTSFRGFSCNHADSLLLFS